MGNSHNSCGTLLLLCIGDFGFGCVCCSHFLVVFNCRPQVCAVPADVFGIEGPALETALVGPEQVLLSIGEWGEGSGGVVGGSSAIGT